MVCGRCSDYGRGCTLVVRLRLGRPGLRLHERRGRWRPNGRRSRGARCLAPGALRRGRPDHLSTGSFGCPRAAGIHRIDGAGGCAGHSPCRRRHRRDQSLRGDSGHPALASRRFTSGRQRAGSRAQAFSSMAREAVELFDVDNAERIRTCAADDCDLVFFDASRSNNRRWCSMQRCGNRAKVRGHRARLAGE